MKFQLRRAISGGHSGRFLLARIIAACALTLFGTYQLSASDVWCVNSGGTSGCFAKIGDAVNAASAGDTIQVSHGTYAESVLITKSLSLLGEKQQNTIIDASGQGFGVYVDGFDNGGVSDVVISGFTVENANYAGIAVSNASNITISNNRVVNNDLALQPGSCPGLASQFFGEAEDCGEGIFLSGVANSTISGNTVTGNAGGMLITDDTGATHDNAVTGNTVVRNTFKDCGITLPSHSHDGVYHNTISGNESSYNGGPGVGIFAPGPGNKAYGNVVTNNRLRGNGLPGVTMHNHASPGVNGVPGFLPPPVFDDNIIEGNVISANSQDFEDAATSGPTGINIYSVGPMTGTVIRNNVIREEAIDISVNIPAISPDAGPQVTINFNNFPNNRVGVENKASATVDAVNNWWGCSGGPGANGCASIVGTSVLFTPWLTAPFQAQ